MYRRSTKQRVALVALIAASATIVTLDFRTHPGGPIRRAQDFAISVVAPLQDGISRVFRPVGDFLSGLGEISGLRSENAELRQRVQELESSQRRLPEILRENERLLGLLGEKDWAAGDRVGARVIGLSPSNHEWAAFIDKGSNDGLAENMAVIAPEGLVGRLVKVSPSYSKVMLLIDSDHSVGARLTASGETGVVTGRSREDLRFELIDPETEVKQSETVVTSGYDGGIYPPGVPIGLVTRSEKIESGLERIAFVRPFVDFSRLDVVMVLLGTGPKVDV